MFTSTRPKLLGALILALAAAIGVAAPAAADDYADALSSIQGKRQWEDAFLGDPVTGITMTPVLRGAFQHFTDGVSIYWSPHTGVRLVYGDIRAHWERLRWEEGPLGFPLTDEYDAPSCGPDGRRNDFEGGSICWTPERGAWSTTRFNVKAIAAEKDASGQVILTLRTGAGYYQIRSVTCRTTDDGPPVTGTRTIDLTVTPNEKHRIGTGMRVTGRRLACDVVATGLNGPEAWTADNRVVAWIG